MSHQKIIYNYQSYSCVNYINHSEECFDNGTNNLNIFSNTFLCFYGYTESLKTKTRITNLILIFFF